MVADLFATLPQPGDVLSEGVVRTAGVTVPARGAPVRFVILRDGRRIAGDRHLSLLLDT